ncbi:ornithine cyclodeaminase [compost metagenome]
MIARSDLIIADMLEEVLEQTGDMIAASAAGIDVRAKAISLGDLLNGNHAQRIRSAQSLLYKSVGSGLQDIVVAELILEKALQAGLATPLPINFETKR